MREKRVQSIRAEIKEYLKEEGKPSSGFAIPALLLDPHSLAGTEGDQENISLFTHHFKPSELPFPGGLRSAAPLNSKYFPSWQMKKKTLCVSVPGSEANVHGMIKPLAHILQELIIEFGSQCDNIFFRCVVQM